MNFVFQTISNFVQFFYQNLMLIYFQITGTQLRDISLPGGKSLIITSISVTQLSSLNLTISSGSTSTITLAAYLKRGGHPSFADFNQVKTVAHFGEVVMFDKLILENGSFSFIMVVMTCKT